MCVCVCVCSINPLVLLISAWPPLAAADHAISHGFDIGAAGNLVRWVVDLWMLWLYVICHTSLISFGKEYFSTANSLVRLSASTFLYPINTAYELNVSSKYSQFSDISNVNVGNWTAIFWHYVLRCNKVSQRTNLSAWWKPFIRNDYIHLAFALFDDLTAIHRILASCHFDVKCHIME